MLIRVTLLKEFFMERININITERQLKVLKQEAKALEIGVSELVRRILDEHILKKLVEKSSG